MIDYEYRSGGLVADAEVRYTNKGAAVASFRIAQSDNYKDDQDQWQTARSLYVPVTIFDEDKGENPTKWGELAGGLRKGDTVVVHGKMVTRQWEDKDGNKRSQMEFQARAVYTPLTTGQQRQQPAQQQGGFGASNANSAYQPQQNTASNGGFSGNDSPPF